MPKLSVFLVSLLLVALPLAGIYNHVIILSSLLPSQESALNLGVPAEIPHAPIVIHGDANFSSTALNEGWSGNGSSEDPFIIDILYIDLGREAGHCINISDTRANFTIQNCNLTGASSGAGIFLENVSFGYLFNNTCTFNGHGIYLLQSTYNVLENNTCFSNSRGIYMYASDFNTVIGNDCDDNNNYGIFLELCDSNLLRSNLCSSTGTNGINGRALTANTFANNTCNQNYGGIRIGDSSFGNIVVNNTCSYNSHYGIRGYNDDIELQLFIINNICTNNENGIEPSGTGVIVTKNNLVDNEIYGIYIEGCDESTFSYNSILRSYEGIWSYYARYNTYSHNEISIGDDGMWFWESQENMISENSISGFIRSGITLEQFSHSNTIYLNDIAADMDSWEPEFYGVDLHSVNDNNVSMNYFLYTEYLPDSYPIRDSGSSNIIDRNWYDEYEDEDYNDDGYWDTAYSIYGSAGNSDPRPLVYPPHPPEWTEPPIDKVIDYWGQSFYYDLNATAPSPISWSVNDTIQFTIDSNGVLQTLSDLPVDSYGIRVRVTTIYGLYLTGAFQLTVQEVSLPEWIVGPSDLVLPEGNTVNLGLIVTDESGISNWSINNTIDFSLTAQHLNVTGYNFGWHLLQITNATVLFAGEYPLTVTAVDPYGNTLSGVFTVTISVEATDVTAPVWISTPTAQVLSYGAPLAMQLVAWDASGIASGWVNDTVHFAVDGSWVLRNISILEPGIYRLEVRMYDLFANFCSANFTVTILAMPSTTTPTTTTTTSGPPTTTTQSSTLPTTLVDGLFPMMTFALGLGIGGGIVVLLVIVLTRRRNR
jgi:parallel beta-helix repeat protein